MTHVKTPLRTRRKGDNELVVIPYASAGDRRVIKLTHLLSMAQDVSQDLIIIPHSPAPVNRFTQSYPALLFLRARQDIPSCL